ncbi:MAG: signal peptide peptidase SppA [Candidatus Gastranaerophilales bacterium]|nr:signal peptide peptidase SppA [Candidatus Gastranaerophilales bacterium]
MKAREISLLILGLCILSLIVGLFNLPNKGLEAKKACRAESKSAIFNKFSASGDKIALIILQGPISSGDAGSLFGDVYNADRMLRALRRAQEDKGVKGVLLRINSPGGTVAMSQEGYNLIMDIRKEKPVVVSMLDVAASGGYYIASAADRIYANPGTLTGSIGVIFETVDASGLLSDKLGIKWEVIKSGKFKDVGSPYRALSPDEKTLLNGLITNTYKQFVNDIIKARVNRTDSYKAEKKVLSKGNLEKYADGRIFTGEQALEYGFVDSLGGLAEATQGIKKMAKQKFPGVSDKIPVVNFNKPSDISELFFNIESRFVPSGNSVESLIPFSKRHPRQPLFMWE